MSNETIAVDFRGNEIRVGDTVLYPRMSGRSCEMTEAEVVDIIAHEKGRRVENPAWEEWRERRKAATPDGERWYNQPDPEDDPRPEAYIAVPAWKFKLRRLRSTRFKMYPWSDPERPVTVQLGENVVRVMDA